MFRAAIGVRGKLIYGPTETHRARTVITPRSVAELLAAPANPGFHGDPVFTAPRGGPLRSSNLRRGVGIVAGARARRKPQVAWKYMIAAGVPGLLMIWPGLALLIGGIVAKDWASERASDYRPSRRL